MEGKAMIFKEFANIDAFPIVLDTQNVDEIVKTIKHIAPVFGAINLEDISAPRCFEVEERIRKELDIPVMHDDQWGAATVTLSAIINSLKLAKLKKEKVRVVIAGVGAAGVATGRLLYSYGIKNIVFCDSKGIIHKGRTDLNKEKKELLNASTMKADAGVLADALIDADVFIGLSKPKTLTEEMIKSMSSKPIIFTLANPTPEILPEAAHKAGAFIVATGRSDYPNQINNSLVFPNAFKAMLDYNIPQFENKIFVTIAIALANVVKKPTRENIIPSMFDHTARKAVYKAVASLAKKK
jgi:malate dehydrogenase (oxaloacetate-decarboxylating)